jgi:hypothetical protein
MSRGGGPAAVEEARHGRQPLLGPQKRLLERAAFCIRDAVDRKCSRPMQQSTTVFEREGGQIHPSIHP